MHSQLKLKDMSMTAVGKNVPTKKGNEKLGNSWKCGPFQVNF